MLPVILLPVVMQQVWEKADTGCWMLDRCRVGDCEEKKPDILATDETRIFTDKNGRLRGDFVVIRKYSL